MPPCARHVCGLLQAGQLMGWSGCAWDNTHYPDHHSRLSICNFTKGTLESDCAQFHWDELHSDQWRTQINAEQHVLCMVPQHAKLRLCLIDHIDGLLCRDDRIRCCDTAAMDLCNFSGSETAGLWATKLATAFEGGVLAATSQAVLEYTHFWNRNALKIFGELEHVKRCNSV